jgi:hypothetical protein
MLALSPGTSLAWKLAATETVRARQRCVEREAMFIGICGLGIWLRAQKSEEILLPTGVVAVGTLRAEVAAVEELLWALGVSPTRVCHAVRHAVGTGLCKYAAKPIVHRSQTCKAAFQRAGALAETARASEIHCLHLLAALLEHPGAIFPRALADCGATVHTLRTRLAATPWLQDAQQAPAKRTEPGVSHLIYVGAGEPG